MNFFWGFGLNLPPPSLPLKHNYKSTGGFTWKWEGKLGRRWRFMTSETSIFISEMIAHWPNGLPRWNCGQSHGDFILAKIWKLYCDWPQFVMEGLFDQWAIILIMKIGVPDVTNCSFENFLPHKLAKFILKRAIIKKKRNYCHGGIYSAVTKNKANSSYITWSKIHK